MVVQTSEPETADGELGGKVILSMRLMQKPDGGLGVKCDFGDDIEPVKCIEALSQGLLAICEAARRVGEGIGLSKAQVDDMLVKGLPTAECPAD